MSRMIFPEVDHIVVRVVRAVTLKVQLQTEYFYTIDVRRMDYGFVTLKNTVILFTALILSLGLSSPSFSHDESETSDLKEIACKDIMRANGEERAIAIALLMGYALGKNDNSLYSEPKLADISDQFIETCLDQPQAKALDTMISLQ